MTGRSDTADAAVEGVFGSVLATRDHAHGVSFWNIAYGFGPLFNASVFSETEAAAFNVAVAQSEPEWLALPAPLRAPA